MRKAKLGAGVLLLLTGFAMICACGLLLWHNERENQAAADAALCDLPKLKEKIEAEKGNPDNMLYQRYLLGDAYIAPDADTAAEEFVIPLDGYSYIGYLTFPTLGLELPVMDGWDAERLRRAPCRYYGSAETQDLVIAAHNYRSSFGQLDRLQIGDAVYFTDAAGIVHRYLVGETEIVEPTAVGYMISSNWDLSLYTCTYDGRHRVTVRCTEQEQPAERSDAA
jgi:sortase A